MIDFCGNMCTPFAHEFKGSSIMIKKKKMILIQEKIVATLLQTHDKKLTATNLNGSTVVVEFTIILCCTSCVSAFVSSCHCCRSRIRLVC